MPSLTERRKLEHIMISLQHPVQHDKTNGFERVKLIKGCALASGNTDTTTKLFGKKLAAPLIIEAMTGGAAGTERINRNLAAAAERMGIGMGVGSQRAALENPAIAHTFHVRDVAPSMLLFGNIGMAQAVSLPMEKIEQAVAMIGADALAIHINPVHESVQPEGDRGAPELMSSLLHKIREIKKSLGIRIVAKEVGFGIPAGLAVELEKAGADAIDVAGAGGTSWVKIEHYRGSKKAKHFFSEGIPTAESLAQCVAAVKVPLIASGGIRTGEEMAKAMAMGASLTGAAMPFLRPALESAEAVESVIAKMTKELREAMTSAGAGKLADLKGRYRLVG